jgi:hypothetical protein
MGKNSFGREDLLNESEGAASSSVKATKKGKPPLMDDLPVSFSPNRNEWRHSYVSG